MAKTSSTKSTPKKMGRPKKAIDWEQFEKLCGIHCTLLEIADYFDCSEDTIERAVEEHYGDTFAEVHKRKQGSGKRSLRRNMWQQAQNGNVTMQIWLSKNVLGYTDKVEQNHSGRVDVNARAKAIEDIFADERSRELARELATRMTKPDTPAEGE